MDFEQNTDPAVLPDLTVNRNGNVAVRHDVEISGRLDVKYVARQDNFDRRGRAGITRDW